MKPQISKVALIAALAFIGIGFGAAKPSLAAGCPKFNCDDPEKCEKEAIAKGCSWGEGSRPPATEKCANCDNGKDPKTGRCVGHIVSVYKEETIITCNGKSYSCFVNSIVGEDRGAECSGNTPTMPPGTVLVQAAPNGRGYSL